MVSLTGARRRAERFDSAVDGRTPPEQLPAELRDLVDVVGSMRRLDPPEPRPEFAAALREQLLAEAETVLVPSSPLALAPRRRGARERRITAAAAVFTLVGGTAGMAVAAQSALPGETLYPIKRGIEDAQLSIQSDPADRGRAYLGQAEDRLEEVTRLVTEEPTSPRLEETVDAFVVAAVAGADLLLVSFEDTRSPDDVETVRSFAADALTRLQTLAESAPADIQDELAGAAVVLQRIDQQASASCEDCSDLPALEMPALMAQAAEISRAMEAVREQRLDDGSSAITVKRPQPSRPGGDGGSDPVLGDLGSAGQAPPGDDVPQLGAGLPSGLPSVLKSPKEALDGVDKATGGLLGQVTTSTEKTVKELEQELDKVLDSTLGEEGLGGLTTGE